MKADSLIGRPVPPWEGFEKVTGEALYTLDLDLPGMLVGKILRSPVAHACILNVDTGRARKVPGVQAVITAADTPRIKFGMGPGFADKLPLEDEKVRYIGDEIAAVAAVDGDAADEALSVIRVDFEELPAVFDPHEAMSPGAPQLHDHVAHNVAVHGDLCCGDPEAGFAQAALVLEEEFGTPAQSHCCLEVHNVAAKCEADGRTTVWASSQSPHALKTRLARACNLPPEKLRIIKLNIGGAFGSKANMMPMDPVAVFLSRKTGRPVRIENSREEEFLTIPPRHPTLSRLRFGFKKDGRLIAKQAKVIMDNGAYNFTGPAILSYHSVMFSALYRVPHIRYVGDLVYTNKVGNASFRGFGTPQAIFGHEVMMDMAAERLGLDPQEIRLINANVPEELTANRVPITSCGLKETIVEAVEKSQWASMRRRRSKGRGIGMACMIYTGAGSNILGPNYSRAAMEVDPEGRVILTIGAADIGQGSNTILLQMAAEILGLAPAQIRLVQGDTDSTPEDIGTKGSRITFCAGNAVVEAARNLRRRILETAARVLETLPEELDTAGQSVFLKKAPETRISFANISAFSLRELKQPLSGVGFFNQEASQADPVTGYGYQSPTMIFGTQIAEVEVDLETGMIKVTRMTCAHDVGRVINPLLAEGQLEGGVVQALGWTLMEDVAFEQGRMKTTDLTDYKMLGSLDVPSIQSLWVETDDAHGPFGAKGFSEGALIPTAPAVVNAIYDAIGIRFRHLPITPEKVLGALKKSGNDRR